MDEKIYKTMGSAGASTLAVGICVLAGGITAGILLIVNGAVAFKYRIHAPRTFYYHVLKSAYTVKSSFRRSVFTVHALFHMTPSAFYRKFLLKLLLFLNFFLFKYICKQEKSKAQSI